VTQRYDIVCLVVPQDKKIELAEVISRIITAVLGDLIPMDLSYQQCSGCIAGQFKKAAAYSTGGREEGHLVSTAVEAMLGLFLRMVEGRRRRIVRGK
jgi:hypothetical protein